MKAQKLSFEDSLEKNVILKDRCAGCAACVLVCPFTCLEYVDGHPRLAKNCESCGICARVCPRFEWSMPEIETIVFGRERTSEEHFGVYQRLLIARTKDEEILEVCQDGGVVTALLVSALQAGLIDGAVVSGVNSEKPLFPEPRLAETVQEIVKCAGTKYSYSPALLTLKNASSRKKDNLAFVGTPCQIQALKKIQAASLKKYVKPIKYTIGLMCTESFNYDCLIEHVKKLDVEPEDVKKMNIKGKLLIFLKSGEVKRISLSELKECVRGGCKFCGDFSSELSDISVGGLGLNGWTFTIIRTSKGEELFETAEKAGLITSRRVESNEPALQLLVKLSKIKRKRI